MGKEEKVAIGTADERRPVYYPGSWLRNGRYGKFERTQNV